MVDIEYIGELLWPKHVGQLLLLVSFITTGLAAYSYFRSAQKKDRQWKRLGNAAFSIHGITMLSVIALIFYVMIVKRYEYSYVQAHVNDDLPFKYIFSAFWEGQEGSFMLWLFWHIILGWVIMLKNSRWVAPVLFFLSLIQFFILSMIQGIYFEFGDWMYKLGSNPLTLLRDTMDIPIFSNAEYVGLLKGSGLNPLLQNYWMTIHPPILFLGFASVSIPFCYALAGLMQREHRAWLKPALTWGLFSGSIFGIGILMGAAWAYEALTFGGYWAWDPVENTSLVPWITIVAGVHTNLIARNTKYSVRSTYWLYIISFLLVLYSTTLTRSGVLGDTSIHAFTEMGLGNQLAVFIGFFTLLSFYYYFSRSKSIDKPKQEESIYSKEFWMFIGSLVLLFSAIMITVSTSIPLYNKAVQLFNPDFVSIVLNDPIEHYNKYQLWIGILVGLLSAVTVFFRYNEKKPERVVKKALVHIGISFGVALVAHILLNLWLQFTDFKWHLLLFSGLFTIVANLEYLFVLAKGNSKLFASAIAHCGFGLLVIGVLASGINKRNISNNSFMFTGLVEEDKLKSNIPLLKNKPMFMNDYWVEYMRDTIIGQNRYFDISFKQVDEQENIIEEFVVRPNVLYSNDLSKVAATNPDTKHYLHKDIFTSVASLPNAQQDVKFAKEMEDTLNYTLVEVPLGVEQEYDGYYIKVNDLSLQADHPDYKPEVGDVPLQISIEIRDSLGKTYEANPATILRSTVVYKYHGQIDDFNSRYRINEQTFDNLIKPESMLKYESIPLKMGESSSWKDYSIKFIGFEKPDKEEKDPFLKEGDVSINGKFLITNQEGKAKTLQPTFIVRDKQIIPIRDVWWEDGFYIKVDYIDPSNGTATVSISKDELVKKMVSLEIANNVPRQDLIAIEVLEFPGINLVWIGCILMMLGLGIGMFTRLIKKRTVVS